MYSFFPPGKSFILQKMVTESESESEIRLHALRGTSVLILKSIKIMDSLVSFQRNIPQSLRVTDHMVVLLYYLKIKKKGWCIGVNSVPCIFLKNTF